MQVAVGGREAIGRVGLGQARGVKEEEGEEVRHSADGEGAGHGASWPPKIGSQGESCREWDGAGVLARKVSAPGFSPSSSLITGFGGLFQTVTRLMTGRWLLSQQQRSVQVYQARKYEQHPYTDQA